jgi:hypothetical protein
MSYDRQAGESTEQYVDRIRNEAANGTISSGPGGTLVQSAIDQARGFGAGSGGKPENKSQSVSDNFFNQVVNSPVYKAANQNQQIYRDPRYVSGPLQFSISSAPGSGGTGTIGNLPTSTPGTYNGTAMADPNTNSAGQATSLSPGMDPNEFEKARQSILYNLQNPEFALSNVLQNKGLSLYNPIIRQGILPAAQGLANAYTVKSAMGNAGPGTDVAGGLSSFISDALNGGGGGIRGVTSSALGSLGSLGSTLWNAANATSAGAVPTNPFIGALLSTLYDPQALTGLQTSLALPNLGSALTSGLQELLGLKSNQAWRGIQPNQSFYNYLSP